MAINKKQMPTTDAIRAELKRENYKLRYKQVIKSTVYALIIVAAIAVLIATLVLPVVQITGTSMEPSLVEGDIVVLIKTDRLKRGDLCAFSYSNKTLIKRVIGTPGDYIDIKSDGTVYVNGAAIEEPYLITKALGDCDIDFPYQVPENQYFLMGDQRDTSIDSRNSVIGCVTDDQMIGKILFRVWPLSKLSFVK
ncbi:MAG: signal peptidase I [Clostridia bacterium]|nr:signal peptidase I [Clostridia bacterium]MBQ8893218.1 signal peptidase I [Clostridia bacterium]